MQFYALLAAILAGAGVYLGMDEAVLLRIAGAALMGLAVVAVHRSMGPNLPSVPRIFTPTAEQFGYHDGARTTRDELAIFFLWSALAGLGFFGLL